MKTSCFTCKYGYEDERLGIPMCHHPKRFSEDCVNFNMHEEKETEESEKPMNLEEAFESEFAKFSNDPDAFYAFPIDLADYKDFAHHFFETGCRRTAEMFDEIEYERQMAEESVPKDLEEAAKKHFKQEWNENYWAFEGNVINTFIAGYNLCKEQMMDEAVEISYKGGTARINGEEKPFDGGTVRVIFLPKEDLYGTIYCKTAERATLCVLDRGRLRHLLRHDRGGLCGALCQGGK